MGLQCAGTGRPAHGRTAVGAVQHLQNGAGQCVGVQRIAVQRPSVPLASIEGIPPTALATQGRPSSMASPKLLGLFSQPDGSKKTSASRYACRMAAASSGPV